MTARARFKKTDVKRAADGARAAGLAIARIEVDPTGKIVIVVGEPSPAAGANSLDRILPHDP